MHGTYIKTGFLHFPLSSSKCWYRSQDSKLSLHASYAALQIQMHQNTGLSKKIDGIWNRYNLKSTGRIYTFGVLKYSEKFKVLDLL